MLIGKGYELSIFDKNVEYARVHGANREYINSKIPHISSLLKSDLQEVINDSEVLVLGLRDRSFEKYVNGSRNERKVVDLVGYRSEEHTSELQSLMRISYAVFCLKKKKKPNR